MKKFKFLFLGLMLVGFLMPMTANAQATVWDWEGVFSVLLDPVDSPGDYTEVEGDWHIVRTPSGNYSYVFQGQLPEGAEAPKKVLKYTTWYDYKVMITPSGQVTAICKIKSPKVKKEK